MNSSALIVFTRVPGECIVKSRIAATHGDRTAARIYNELLEQTAKNLSGYAVHVAFGGAPDAGTLRNIFPHAQSFFPQAGDTLGARMRNAMQHLFDKGFRQVALMGCDCPDLNLRIIEQAFEALEHGDDAVVVPVQDGGYCLLATTSGHLDIFSLSEWGTADVLNKTILIAQQHDWRCKVFETLSDIDSFDDYVKWKKTSE